jgi:PHD/YefM family antitoxin component YafN of YafNO toxin-antitoxin module
MLKTISAQEAQEQLSNLLKQVRRDGQPLLIIEGDESTTVLLPIEQYEFLLSQTQDSDSQPSKEGKSNESLEVALAKLDRHPAAVRNRVDDLFETMARLDALNFPPMTEDEIQREIDAVRAKRQDAHAGSC